MSDELKKYAIQLFEEVLQKGPNYWKDKNPAKYRKMLNKLKSERKKPGSKERAYQQVLQAKRREKGGKGVKAGHDGNGHSKGRMTTKTGSAVKRYQSSEKKAGTKLSIDRKDNKKGYAAGNTRNIPQKLNRGRHKADPKKVENWRKKLKKSELTIDDFKTLLMAKALHSGNENLASSIEGVTEEQLLQLVMTGEVGDAVSQDT